MNKEVLRNRKTIAVLRVSSESQKYTSIDNQDAALARVEADAGATRVDTVRMEGVSASNPVAIKAVYQKLIDRKRAQDDFDTVVLYDASRLTRKGNDHAGHLTWILKEAGIRVVYADSTGDELVDGLLRAVSATTAQQQVALGARKIADGQSQALREGRMLPWPTPPLGIDRLVCGLDGRPVALIRRVADRPVEELDPETHEVRQTHSRGYRKQKDNHYVAVPSGDDRQELVVEIFRRRDIDGLGPRRIAVDLNRRGVRSPRGSEWTQEAVRAIYDNETYLGYTYTNKKEGAEYANRDRETGHRRVEGRAEDERTPSGRYRLRRRPRSEWVRVEHPELVDFLPPEIRALAAVRIEAGLDRWARGGSKVKGEGVGQRVGRLKGKESAFFLSRIAHSPQGIPLVGHGGCGNGRYRYYRLSAALSRPGTVRNRGVPAECLEETVLDAMEEALLGAVDVRAEIVAAIRDEQAEAATAQDERPPLERRLTEIDKESRLVIGNGVRMSERWVEQELDRLGAERREIEHRLDRLDRRAPMLSDAEIERAADELIAEMVEQGGLLRSLEPGALTMLASLLIEDLTVDPETREVSLTLAIPCSPAWPVGLNGGPLQQNTLQAHTHEWGSSGPCGLRIGSWSWRIDRDCRQALRDGEAKPNTESGVHRDAA